MLGATIQMAWKHGRNYHLIKTRRGYDPELLAHLEAHELTHLKLESEARQKSKNLFFATSAQSREAGIRSIAGDIRKLEKQAYSEESITKMTLSFRPSQSGGLEDQSPAVLMSLPCALGWSWGQSFLTFDTRSNAKTPRCRTGR